MCEKTRELIIRRNKHLIDFIVLLFTILLKVCGLPISDLLSHCCYNNNFLKVSALCRPLNSTTGYNQCLHGAHVAYRGITGNNHGNRWNWFGHCIHLCAPKTLGRNAYCVIVLMYTYFCPYCFCKYCTLVQTKVARLCGIISPNR